MPAWLSDLVTQHLYFLASDLADARRADRGRAREVHFRQAMSAGRHPRRLGSAHPRKKYYKAVTSSGQVYFAEANGRNSHARLLVVARKAHLSNVGIAELTAVTVKPVKAVTNLSLLTRS